MKDLRLIGVARFVLGGDRSSFSHELATSARIRLSLIEREINRDADLRGYRYIFRYFQLFDALAAQAWDYATAIASKIDIGPPDSEAVDLAFSVAMGFSLKHAVLKEPDQLRHWVYVLESECQKAQHRNFDGYAMAFRRLVDTEDHDLHGIARQIVIGHIKESRGNGHFSLSEDEVLSVWGVGIANLSRHFYGIEFPAEPPLIPAELLCPVRK